MPVYGPNILTDLPNSSTFESGTAGWTPVAPYTTKTTSTLEAHSGTQSMLLTLATGTYYAYAYHVLTALEIGEPYRFTAWAKEGPSSPSGSPSIYMAFGTDSLTWTEISDGAWHELSVDHVAEAAEEGIYLYVGMIINGNSAFFDDISVRREYPDGTIFGEMSHLSLGTTELFGLEGENLTFLSSYLNLYNSGEFTLVGENTSIPASPEPFTEQAWISVGSFDPALPAQPEFELYWTRLTSEIAHLNLSSPGTFIPKIDVALDSEVAHLGLMGNELLIGLGMLAPTADVAFTSGVGELVNEDFLIAGATAGASFDAGAGTATIGVSSITLAGATAALIAASPVAALEIAPDTILSGVTAMATMLANAGGVMSSALPIAGDFLFDPIPIVYTEIVGVNVQAFYPNLFMTGTDVDEPEIGTLVSTVWYTIWSDQPLTIAVTYSGAITSMDLFEGYPVTSTNYIAEFDVAANTLYYLRAGTDTPNGVAEFILTATPVVSSATIGAGNIDHTPATITINGGGFPPNSPITVSLSGGVIATVESDASGILVPTDVQIIGSLTAGTYSITGQSGSTIALGSFMVLNDPLPTVNVTPDSVPTITVGTRWMLRDPYTTGHIADFTFVTNPSEMSSPYAPVNLTADVTTQGTSIMWEGGLRAHEWTFSGILETEAEFNSLTAYRKIGRRFHLRDHRNRIWTVTFTNLDVQPLRVYPALMRGMSPGAALHKAPWAHKYTVSALIYAGPVDAE